MTNEVGRPTVLNDELYVKIRELYLEGKTVQDVATALDIPLETMQSWNTRNYHGFRDRMLSFKHERMLLKAEDNLDSMMEMDTQNTGTTMKGDIFEFNDPRLVKVKADVSVFVSETLGRRHYTKSVENKNIHTIFAFFII